MINDYKWPTVTRRTHPRLFDTRYIFIPRRYQLHTAFYFYYEMVKKLKVARDQIITKKEKIAIDEAATTTNDGNLSPRIMRKVLQQRHLQEGSDTRCRCR
jgi:hypothetical protein